MGRWYLGSSSAWADSGVSDRALDYQVWCGPAIGSFNNFIRGSYLDPLVAKCYMDVYEANMQLLLGTCVLRRCAQVKADSALSRAVDESALAPYRPTAR